MSNVVYSTVKLFLLLLLLFSYLVKLRIVKKLVQHLELIGLKVLLKQQLVVLGLEPLDPPVTQSLNHLNHLHEWQSPRFPSRALPRASSHCLCQLAFFLFFPSEPTI